MNFDKEKQNVLDKLYQPDQSRKGDVDQEIKELINTINKNKNYYTTSSCAGRILILEEATNRQEIKWHYYNHQPADSQTILDSLQKATDNMIWFKFESLILHICARTLEHALELLKAVHKAGFKRAGITTMQKRIIIEIIGTQRFEAPIMNKKTLLVSQEYLNLLTEQANKKMQENFKRIELLKNHLQKLK